MSDRLDHPIFAPPPKQKKKRKWIVGCIVFFFLSPLAMLSIQTRALPCLCEFRLEAARCKCPAGRKRKWFRGCRLCCTVVLFSSSVPFSLCRGGLQQLRMEQQYVFFCRVHSIFSISSKARMTVHGRSYTLQLQYNPSY